MIIETTINLKNKSKEELILLLNESLGVIEKLQKENELAKQALIKNNNIADERDEIKQEYDRDTHILQNQLDLANAKKYRER